MLRVAACCVLRPQHALSVLRVAACCVLLPQHALSVLRPPAGHPPEGSQEARERFLRREHRSAGGVDGQTAGIECMQRAP